MEKKKGGAGKVIFWVLSPVWLLLLLAVLAVGALFLMGYSYDDPELIMAQQPMSVSERYVFHADARTCDMRVDKSDLLFVMEQNGDADVEKLTEPLADYNLALKAYGFSFTETGVSVTAQLQAFSFLPLPVKVDLGVEAQPGGGITLSVEKATLAKLISMSGEQLAEKLRMDPSDLTFEIDGENIHPRMKQLNAIRFEPDSMILTFSVGEELYDVAMENAQETRNIGYYMSGIPALSVFLESNYRDGAESFTLPESFTDVLKKCEENPAYYVDFRIETLAIANAIKAEMYLTDQFAPYIERFLPGVTSEAVKTLHDGYEKYWRARRDSIMSIVATLDRKFANEEISFAGDHFIYLPEDAPLSLDQLAGEGFVPYQEWLNAESARFILACGSDDITYRCKRIKALPNTGKSALSHVDPNTAYAIMLCVRMVDGTPVLTYYVKGLFVVRELSEADYNSLTTSAFVPVYSFEKVG